MKAPLSWLKEYVDIDVDVNTLCEKLVSIGWEVEELTYLGEGIRNVVDGKVHDITKHPNADRLRVCQVDIGGAKSFRLLPVRRTYARHVVPVALDDSDLPCGKHIVRGELRGVDSNGMLCGGSELE